MSADRCMTQMPKLERVRCLAAGSSLLQGHRVAVKESPPQVQMNVTKHQTCRATTGADCQRVEPSQTSAQSQMVNVLDDLQHGSVSPVADVVP